MLGSPSNADMIELGVHMILGSVSIERGGRDR